MCLHDRKYLKISETLGYSQDEYGLDAITIECTNCHQTWDMTRSTNNKAPPGLNIRIIQNHRMLKH